jgi:hypothetical protein
MVYMGLDLVEGTGDGAEAGAGSGGGNGVVTLGNMVLRDGGFRALKGHRVAVLTNPTGVFVDTMEHIVDVMHDDSGVDVVAVFGPEHGFRGDKQAETGDPRFYIDDSTKLPVFSAYNMTSLELSDVMVRLNITTVVVDMQVKWIYYFFDCCPWFELGSNYCVSTDDRTLVCDCIPSFGLCTM